MRLGYFTMPLHPAHRAPSQTLQEDREAVILADAPSRDGKAWFQAAVAAS
jgi:hypothetical protein